jgi:hypothetical protein
MAAKDEEDIIEAVRGLEIVELEEVWAGNEPTDDAKMGSTSKLPPRSEDVGIRFGVCKAQRNIPRRFRNRCLGCQWRDTKSYSNPPESKSVVFLGFVRKAE